MDWDWAKMKTATEAKNMTCGRLVERLCMGAVAEEFLIHKNDSNWGATKHRLLYQRCPGVEPWRSESVVVEWC